jgi:hypothetical protein
MPLNRTDELGEIKARTEINCLFKDKFRVYSID